MATSVFPHTYGLIINQGEGWIQFLLQYSNWIPRKEGRGGGIGDFSLRSRLRIRLDSSSSNADFGKIGTWRNLVRDLSLIRTLILGKRSWNAMKLVVWGFYARYRAEWLELSDVFWRVIILGKGNDRWRISLGSRLWIFYLERSFWGREAGMQSFGDFVEISSWTVVGIIGRALKNYYFGTWNSRNNRISRISSR